MDEATRAIDEAEGFDVEVPQELWDMLDGNYEPILQEPATINAVDDPILDPLAKYELQLRDSKTFNDKWGDSELRVRENRLDAQEEATLETAADDTVGFDRLINRGLTDGFDAAKGGLSDLSYKPTYSEPNWFQRNVLRQKPQPMDEPVFEIGDEMVDVEDEKRPFEDFSDAQLDELDTRIDLVESQLSTNVDTFKKVAAEAREQLDVGEMEMGDVADYINQELQANENARGLLEDLGIEDIDEKMENPPQEGPHNLEQEPDLEDMDMDAWAEQEFGPEYQDPMVEPFEPEQPLSEFDQYMLDEYPNYYRVQGYQENVTLDPPEMNSTWEPFEIDSSMVANANEAVAEMGVELWEGAEMAVELVEGGLASAGAMIVLQVAQLILETIFADHKRHSDIWGSYRLPTMGQFMGEWVKDTDEWKVQQIIEDQKKAQIIKLQEIEAERWQDKDVWYHIPGYFGWLNARSKINDKFGWLHFPPHAKVTDYDQYIWDYEVEQRRWIEGQEKAEYIVGANMDLGDTVRLDLTVNIMDLDNFGEPRSYVSTLKEPYDDDQGNVIPQSEWTPPKGQINYWGPLKEPETIFDCYAKNFKVGLYVWHQGKWKMVTRRSTTDLSGEGDWYDISIMNVWLDGEFVLHGVGVREVYKARWKAPQDLALFPRTKFLIDQERDARANKFEPKYKEGDKWNSMYPTGKLILVTVPKTKLGEYGYIIITKKGATDPGVQGAAMESELDKWIETGILKPYTEWTEDKPKQETGGGGGIYNPDNEEEINQWLEAEGLIDDSHKDRERDHSEQLQKLHDKAEALKESVPWMSNLWLDLDDATLMQWEDKDSIKAAIDAAKDFIKQQKSWMDWPEEEDPPKKKPPVRKDPEPEEPEDPPKKKPPSQDPEPEEPEDPPKKKPPVRGKDIVPEEPPVVYDVVMPMRALMETEPPAIEPPDIEEEEFVMGAAKQVSFIKDWFCRWKWDQTIDVGKDDFFNKMYGNIEAVAHGQLERRPEGARGYKVDFWPGEVYKSFDDRFPERESEGAKSDYLCFLLMHEILDRPPDFETTTTISIKSTTWNQEKFEALKRRPTAMQFLMAPDKTFHDEYEEKNEEEWDPENEAWLDMCEKGRLQGVWWWGVMNFYVKAGTGERMADGFGDNIGIFVEEMLETSRWPFADVLCAFMPGDRREMGVPVQQIFDEVKSGKGIKWTEELAQAQQTLINLREIALRSRRDDMKEAREVLETMVVNWDETIEGIAWVLERLQSEDFTRERAMTMEPPPMHQEAEVASIKEEPEDSRATSPILNNPYVATVDEDEQDEGTQPRRSARIAAQPAQGYVDAFPRGHAGDVLWGQWIDQYREKIGGFIPAPFRKGFMTNYLDYLSPQDHYIGRMFNLPSVGHAPLLFFPNELFKLDEDNRQFFARKLQFVISGEPDAETYCKAIVCALMVKDMMRVVCTLVYNLDEGLWQTGKVSVREGDTKAELAAETNRRRRTIEVFNNLLMARDWWPKDFVNPPTAIPYRITTNLWTMAATKFERFTDSFGLVMGKLVDLRNQLGQTKSIIVELMDPHGEKVDDEKAGGEEREEIDNEAGDEIAKHANSATDYDNFKNRLVEDLKDLMVDRGDVEDDRLRASIEFLQAKSTPGGPVVVNLTGGSKESGFGGGGSGGFGVVGGLLFTLWLISNMS